MKRLLLASIPLAIAQLAMAGSASKDPGSPDKLRLAGRHFDNGEYRVAVHVDNDEELAGMDVPLRFGQPGDPITLDRVEWSSRVEGWDLLHAKIDNDRKTVVLGLISELYGARPDPELKVVGTDDPTVALLIFKTDGKTSPVITTFTTQRPTHALTYIYNRHEKGRTDVVEFTPAFEVVDDE
jgi:hypothetical protein